MREKYVDGLISGANIAYTSSTMSIDHWVAVPLHITLTILALIFLVLFPPLGLIMFWWLVHQRSYHYALDKEQRTLECVWDGFWGTKVGEHKKSFFLYNAAYIKIQQAMLGQNNASFKVKLGFFNGDELDLPAQSTLSSCMEYANFYKDFLGLKAPIRGA